MTSTWKVDVVVLGAGTAGLTARRAAEKAGASTLLVDPGPLGTTCARVGCMPSKLLIAAADAAHAAGQAELFGLRAHVTVDGRRVMARVKRERDRFVGDVLRSIEALREKGLFLQGTGRFAGPDTIRVDEHTEVQARAVVVATGSKSVIPAPYCGLGDALMTNEQIFEMDDLPESLLVLGTGIIGLELGQALARLGVRVTLIGKLHDIGPLSDPVMKEEALRIFSGELDLHTEHELYGVRREGDGVEIRFTDSAGRERKERYRKVLAAAGMRPNLGGLQLERAGIVPDDRGIPPFDPHTMQIGDRPVFLAGDVNGMRPFLHEAAAQGKIAGENAARYPDVLTQPRSVALSIVFTDPQMAAVGRPWSELRCGEDRIGEVDFSSQGRSRVMAADRGRARIYGAYDSGLIEGVEMLGPRVEHLAHLIAWSMEKKMSVSEALSMPFYHPVVEEGLRTALRDLEASLRIAHRAGAECDEFGPGG
ncbi:MAG: dihydrolipoyl dehydrogenase [bacterium]